MLPKARKNRLVIEELPEETLVYDLDRHEAHCLNREAALVWRAANGQRTLEEIAERVGKKVGGGAPVEEEEIERALESLGKARLLEQPLPAPRFSRSRRRLLRNLLFAPVVLSVLAPTPAQAAQSCRQSGAPCGNTNSVCCSNVCLPSHRCL
jgi:hypothetical protein